MALADRPTELSEEVLEEVKKGQQTAIEAVREFTESVDKTLRSGEGEEASRVEEIVDSALNMADRLVGTQYDFLHKVVHSAGKSLGASDASE